MNLRRRSLLQRAARSPIATSKALTLLLVPILALQVMVILPAPAQRFGICAAGSCCIDH